MTRLCSMALVLGLLGAVSAPAGMLVRAPAPPDNPLKGFVPYPGSSAANRFPHSLEWDYTRLSEVMTGPTDFDWTPFERKLNAAGSRGCQFIARFYLEWPGRKTGVPQFLIDAGLRLRAWTNTNTQPFPPAVDHTPDYEDSRLCSALTNFIRAFGARYDGDPRLGFVGLGLLGTWGEWHNSPHDEWFASKAVQRQVMDAYEVAFRKTRLMARYPAGPGHPRYADNSRRSFGYHDDSFAWATVHTGRKNDDWFFETLLRQAEALDKWRTQAIGGEVRPEVWDCLFDEPACAPKGQEFDRCVSVTHASWLCNEGVFRSKLQGSARQRALLAARSLGYELQVLERRNLHHLALAGVAGCDQLRRGAVLLRLAGGIGCAGFQGAFGCHLAHGLATDPSHAGRAVHPLADYAGSQPSGLRPLSSALAGAKSHARRPSSAFRQPDSGRTCAGLADGGRHQSMNVYRISLCLLAVAVLRAPPVQADFRAGAARSCITPALGTRINGGVGPGVARHIHDDLFVRALVLGDGTNRLALAVVDTCLLDRPVFDEAKRLVQQHTGLQPRQVMMSCTHTHSAGSGCSAHLVEADEAYRAWLPGRIADAVRCAANNLAPAQAAWGSGSVPQHVFCRRLLLKPGVTYTNQLGFTNELAKMNWDSPHPADGEPAGPTDPEVFVLSVRHADGRPLALLANYSLHYVGDVGPGHISADYFGAFADRIQQLLGADRQDPPFVGILCNGTSGDVNNINPRTKREPAPPYTQIRRVADDVAREVLRVTTGLQHRSDLTVGCALRECVVGTRRPNAAEVELARSVVAGRPVERLSGWTDNYAREQLILADWPAEVSMPLQVIRIGDLAIAGWPGEIFAASGLDLKRRSPVKPLFNISLANGWYGYIPPPDQFAVGAYETWRMRTSPLETNAIPKMTDCLLGLLESSQAAR